ncbi:hypothetical protein MRBLMN1_004476 [Chitinophaga ginsengisegetis]|uniref:hypothetical protein n=1 Tax=Chitinophaga ginsengisegetis TaxID=393003 RepID=UPI00342B4307
MVGGSIDVKIEKIATGELLDALIEPMTVKDFLVVKKSKNRFDKFNWNQYTGKEVYKLKLKGNDILLGLICLVDHTDPGIDAIEIELLEVSAEHIGKEKQLDHIGGCLIAFACRESFKRGHEGCVFLVPKTSLINYYKDKYGFEKVTLKTPDRPNGFMILYESGSRRLIKTYIDRD